MTTTPAPAMERMTPAELRREFAEIDATLAEMASAIEYIRQKLDSSMSATPPAQTPGQFAEMEISSIVKSYDDNGKATYKGKGIPYPEFGVRIWEEVIALLIDPASLNNGTNPINPPIRARVLLGEVTKKDGTKGIGPRKVTGKA